MLHNLLHKAAYAPLILGQPRISSGSERAGARWKQYSPVVEALLDMCVHAGQHALIDVGALMAGMSNEEVAEQLAARLRPDRYRAVLYFDQRSRCLTVRELDRRQGAAGRMRGLEFGQRLVIVAPQEVDAMIREVSANSNGSSTSVSVSDILNYVTVNSIESVRAGLAQWVGHGTHFAATTLGTEDARLPEKATLEDMYAGASTEKPLLDLVNEMQQFRASDQCSTLTAGGVGRAAVPAALGGTAASEQNGSDQVPVGQQLAKHILRVCTEIGADVLTKASSQDTECEREWEKEQEQEEEQKRQLPAAKARADHAWKAKVLLTARTLKDVEDATPMSLAEFMGAHAQSLAPLPWDLTRIYGTRNFFQTFEGTSPANSLDMTLYMRAVDAVVLLPGPEGRPEAAALLLLSEREADQALYAFWQVGGQAKTTVFANLTYLKEAAARVGTGTGSAASASQARISLALPSSEVRMPAPVSLAGLQLFCGDTRFAHAGVEQAVLNSMLTSQGALAAAKEVAVARGRSHELDKSTLEVLWSEQQHRLRMQEQASQVRRQKFTAPGIVSPVKKTLLSGKG